jgi:hypothetical protein
MKQNQGIIPGDACHASPSRTLVASLFKSRHRLQAEKTSFFDISLILHWDMRPNVCDYMAVTERLLTWMTWLLPSLLGLARVVQPDTIL